MQIGGATTQQQARPSGQPIAAVDLRVKQESLKQWVSEAQELFSTDHAPAARVARAELQLALGRPLPATGPLDLMEIARMLDTSGDGLLDAKERGGAAKAFALAGWAHWVLQRDGTVDPTSEGGYAFGQLLLAMFTEDFSGGGIFSSGSPAHAVAAGVLSAIHENQPHDPEGGQLAWSKVAGLATERVIASSRDVTRTDVRSGGK